MNAAFKAAADGALKGILASSDEPLVSIDFRGNPARRSSTPRHEGHGRRLRQGARPGTTTSGATRSAASTC